MFDFDWPPCLVWKSDEFGKALPQKIDPKFAFFEADG
jgi:hypothetical protein